MFRDIRFTNIQIRLAWHNPTFGLGYFGLHAGYSKLHLDLLATRNCPTISLLVNNVIGRATSAGAGFAKDAV